jgi:septum formation protein
MLDMILSGRNLILASASPRRKELLAGLGVDFTIDTGNIFEEVIPDGLTHPQVPEYMAKGKSHGFHRELQSDEIIITADTMVLCEDEIMGKPKDREDAVRMIEKLQDNTHTVYTGVCIRSLEKEVCFTVGTNVQFGKLTPDEISYYIDTCKPFDKAGAYGIQEWIGYVGVDYIEGSFFNVMGLPIQKLYSVLKTF